MVPFDYMLGGFFFVSSLKKKIQRPNIQSRFSFLIYAPQSEVDSKCK